MVQKALMESFIAWDDMDYKYEELALGEIEDLLHHNYYPTYTFSIMPVYRND
jgi:hypothetical protein